MAINKLTRNLFKILGCILLLYIILGTGLALANNPPYISGSAAVLIDVETAQVLYEKNKDVQRAPASLTKVLTTIIALEEGDLDHIVTASRRAAYQGGSSIYLEEGEKLTLEELLYGVMLASGNDAAVAVAEYISGSIEEFAKLMNQRAKEMGAKNSNFLNPNGLPQTGHLTTVYDLAMIMRYALQNEKFREITATKHKTISWADNNWGRGLRNHNKLLWSFPGTTGGKTGFTNAAGPCLLASAALDLREVVVVVLNSSNKYMETQQLLTYGLNNFERFKVINRGDLVYVLPWVESQEKELTILAQSNIAVVVPEGKEIKVRKELILKEELKLPINKGDEIGLLTVYQGEQFIGKTILLAGNDLTFNSYFLRLWYYLRTKLQEFIEK